MAKKIAISGEMVGRPANGTKQYQVQLEPAQVARIDALHGGKSHRRSAFIRDAIEAELARREAAR